MTTIIIAVLFLLQLGSFYMIALLYMRITKVDKLESQQKKLMAEMEDSLALYMSEVKEENERFMKQLTEIQGRPSLNYKKDEEKKIESSAPKEETAATSPFFKPKPPAAKVLNSYRTQQQATKDSLPSAEDKNREETEFEKVYRLNKEGLSLEDIASRLGKGKTEIELILKFKQ